MGQINLQTPIVGNPDSSEEPKIPSDFGVLQTLLNGNVDGTNLLPSSGIWRFNYRLVSSNVTAANGDWIVAQGGLTVTLPAPSLNALVAITAKLSVSPTSFITVAAAEVVGVGLGSGTTSFRLGTPGASVVLQSDGITWRIVSGQQDTGGVAAAVGGSISSTMTGRVLGDRVLLGGEIVNNGGSVPALTTFATLPASVRPTVATVTGVTLQTTSLAPALIQFGTNGAVSSLGALPGGGVLYFDTCAIPYA